MTVAAPSRSFGGRSLICEGSPTLRAKYCREIWSARKAGMPRLFAHSRLSVAGTSARCAGGFPLLGTVNCNTGFASGALAPTGSSSVGRTSLVTRAFIRSPAKSYRINNEKSRRCEHQRIQAVHEAAVSGNNR